MLCTEHLIENALSAIHNGLSYEQWVKYEEQLNLPYVRSDPKEVWEMANYVYCSERWNHGDMLTSSLN